MTERAGAGVMEPKWRIPERAMPHLGHEKHLCHLVEHVGLGITQYKPLVRNARFLCKKCGRVAAKEENLCEPIKL